MEMLICRALGIPPGTEITTMDLASAVFSWGRGNPSDQLQIALALIQRAHVGIQDLDGYKEKSPQMREHLKAFYEGLIEDAAFELSHLDNAF